MSYTYEIWQIDVEINCLSTDIENIDIFEEKLWDQDFWKLTFFYFKSHYDVHFFLQFLFYWKKVDFFCNPYWEFYHWAETNKAAINF